jgi:hypothetical protein
MNYKKYTLLMVNVLLLTAFSRPSPEYDQDKYSATNVKASKPVMEYRVHRAGMFWLNTSNMGFFGEPWLFLKDPCTGKPAVSGEMPGGTGTEFIWLGALMFGGYLHASTIDLKGHSAALFDGPFVTTAYEGWNGDPMPMELWPAKFDEDLSGATLGHIHETSNIEGKLSCLFEDVYDPRATAEEQFNVCYTDKYVSKVYTGFDTYDQREHIPLGIEVRQKSYAWSYDYARKFIIADFTLYNRNEDNKDIYDFFMGFYVDSDVGMKERSEGWYMDDLCGFVQKWDRYVDPATGEIKTVDLNMAWSADNDGRDPLSFDPSSLDINEPHNGPLSGARGVASLRVLRNPNPNLRYSFNIYVCDSNDESLDWGPHWKTGLHSDWQYDLTPKQKGYDDTNHDELFNASGQQMYNGRTEGYPAGDKGKYMVMSNDEFDYNQTQIRDVYLGTFEDPDYMAGTWYAQADKWQKWIADGEQQGGEIADGPISSLNDIANGMDERYLLSFGPLGYDSFEDIAVDLDQNGTFEDYINKKVWRFAHGDSLKLTIAFIANDYFHTSLDQDPNYSNDGIVDTEDGLNTDLYEKGWYDALYNVVWAERVYDIPMFDTPVNRNGAVRSDGWYGEDVGRDGLFGELRGDIGCWWYDSDYPGPDEGESDFILTDFSSSITDIYGNTSDGEDNLLPFGRKIEDATGVHGITGDPATGEGYGYMIKYDKLGGDITQGTWVRYGFDNGRLDPGDGVPDFTGPPPPPSPKIKVSSSGSDIIIEWSSHEIYEKDGAVIITGSEHFVDNFTRRKDFEGYQVHVSPDENSLNYTEVFSVDKVNMIYENVSESGDYLDIPVTQERYNTLVQNDSIIISSENKIWQLKPFGDNRDIYSSHEKTGIYSYTCTKDTISITYGTDSVVTAEVFSYRFVLHNKLLGSQCFVAVTASDFGDPGTGVPSLKSNPSVNGTSVVPSLIKEKDVVMVVPNPYRGDIDYESIGWENKTGGDKWEEQDRKIAFLNLPERCVIRIYTLAGDLVKTIGHNSGARYSDPYMYGSNGAYWNLINDNRQACLSGLYLFSVQDADKKKDDFVGKFVIIK